MLDRRCWLRARPNRAWPVGVCIGVVQRVVWVSIPSSNSERAECHCHAVFFGGLPLLPRNRLTRALGGGES